MCAHERMHALPTGAPDATLHMRAQGSARRHAHNGVRADSQRHASQYMRAPRPLHASTRSPIYIRRTVCAPVARRALNVYTCSATTRANPHACMYVCIMNTRATPNYCTQAHCAQDTAITSVSARVIERPPDAHASGFGMRTRAGRRTRICIRISKRLPRKHMRTNAHARLCALHMCACIPVPRTYVGTDMRACLRQACAGGLRARASVHTCIHA
jgi:hypothetical protein